MTDSPMPPVGEVAQAFGRASARYDAAAALQAQVREELLSRLDVLDTPPAVVVDLGAGTGAATAVLKRRFPRAQVIAVDAAAGMLEQVGRRSRFWRPLRRVQADAAALPLRDASVDLVFSSLMLQWCHPPDAVLAELRRVLKPRGLLLLSSFGPSTLQELRQAWAQVDTAEHVNAFIDLMDLGAALQRAGFTEPVLDVDRLLRHVPDAATLARDLKAIGANRVGRGRATGLTGPRRYQAMQQVYEAQRQPSGLPVSWEIVYATAWAPAARLANDDGADGQAIGLETVLASLRQRRQRP
jgi:malonyl-CoA O-methyltransferase